MLISTLYITFSILCMVILPGICQESFGGSGGRDSPSLTDTALLELLDHNLAIYENFQKEFEVIREKEIVNMAGSGNSNSDDNDSGGVDHNVVVGLVTLMTVGMAFLFLCYCKIKARMERNKER